jgi:antitoxin component YwqK of YwqJK toxin-antitoxin module
MKILLLLTALALAGCYSYRKNDIVKETYLHKYGTPLTPTDWESQGKEGQTVALRKDGVSVTTTYSQGEIDGPMTYSYPNSSTIRTCETYSHGRLISKQENYPSGIPMKEENYEEAGILKLTRWYEDGTPQTEEIYHNATLFSGEYRTPLNVVESRVIEGEGTRFCRAGEGELVSKDTIQRGQMVERVTYHPNGDPATITPYHNGLVEGIRLTFLQGGLPHTVEQWVQGQQEGGTTVYQNGEKIAEVPYHLGEKHGIEQRYRDGITVVEEVSWQNNIQHGPRTLYVDGEAKTEYYLEGELVSRPAYEWFNHPRHAA